MASLPFSFFHNPFYNLVMFHLETSPSVFLPLSAYWHDAHSLPTLMFASPKSL